MRKLIKALLVTVAYVVALWWLLMLMNTFRYSYLDGYTPQILGISSFVSILAVIAVVPYSQRKVANIFVVSAGLTALALWYFASEFGYADITYYNAKAYGWETPGNLQLLAIAIPVTFAIATLSVIALTHKNSKKSRKSLSKKFDLA